MADELVDVLDESGKNIGTQVMKSEAHRKGLWHPAVHIWIFNSKGEVLLQKRAAGKEVHPSKWDISAAGHLGAGEESGECALREIGEELGVFPKKEELKKKGLMRKPPCPDGKISCNSHPWIFLWKCDKKVTDFTLQKSEVEKVRFIPLAQFEREFEASKEYVPHGQAYYRAVSNLIRKELYPNIFR